jgi:hypothetical protein
VEITASVAPLITDTLLLAQLPTKMRLVVGLTAIPWGSLPTPIVAMTESVAPLMTKTLPGLFET